METIVINVPMVIDGPPPLFAGAPRTSMDTLLVRIETDEGVVGWGEGFGHRIFPATKVILDELVGPRCIGRDALAIPSLMHDLHRNLVGAGRNGPTTFALSAVDIALWDIAGKVAGQPLYRLLGGAERRSLPAYASLLKYDDAVATGRRVETMLGRGYRHIKIHEAHVEPIAAARDAAGPDVPLMLDCTRAWSLDEALTMTRRLESYGLAWIEEPIFPPEDLASLAILRARGTIPTAAGENAMPRDFRTMFELAAVSVAQPSVTKLGGVSRMQQVIGMADLYGVRVVPHAAYFGPGLLATIHVAAAMAVETPIERYDADFATNPYGDAIIPDADGRLHVPQGPGLGLEPDPTVIERMRVA